MLKALKVILDIQELDMQMIRLMRLKRDRSKELANIDGIKKDLRQRALTKNNEVTELKKHIKLDEIDVQGIAEHLKKLEGQQGSIRKVEEFNALSQEMATLERERHNRELRLSEMCDKLTVEEDLLKSLEENLETTGVSSKEIEDEIQESIRQINIEGRGLLEQREQLVTKAESDVFRVYERLLRNKQGRVVVPIENRCCTGCHIMLTAQDENLVRKGERLIFCEHCSRIQYWPESEALEGTASAPRAARRRRRATTAS